MAEVRLPVAVVTGANRGIGKAIVEGLAAAGRHVVLVCRRAEDGEAAARDIRGRHPQASLEVAGAELASLDSVRALASRLLARHPHIAILVNNAAVALRQRQESVDGIEMTLAVNHLAPFALTLLLLPALRSTGDVPSRVVTVSSGSQHGRKIVIDDLQNRRRRYGGVRVYGESKLMNVLFTRELARQGRTIGIAAYSLHPGVIGTSLLIDYVSLPAPLRSVFARFTGTPAEGADTAVWLATAPGLEAQSGGFFVRRKLARSNPLADDPVLAARLWEASEQLTGESWPG